MDQICSQREFLIKNEKSEHRHWILHIRISLCIKFHLKLIILTFWTKFAHKGHFWSKTKKVNTTIEFCIFELVYVSSFTLNWQYWQFGPNLPKKGILIESEKSEHCHWILHIRISLWIKFRLKLTILTIWTKFAQKRHSGQKPKKWTASLNSGYSNYSRYQICPKRLFPVKNEKGEQHHWILHIRIRLGAIILRAMTLLGQSRESWPSMAPLGHVENSQTKMLWHF